MSNINPDIEEGGSPVREADLRIRRRDLSYGREVAQEFDMIRLQSWWAEMSPRAKRRIRRADPYLYSLVKGLAER